MKMNLNPQIKNLILLSLLRIVSISLLGYCYFRYYEYNLIAKEENPIEYSISSAKKGVSGKSTYGLIQIEFDQKEYELQIQKEEYYDYVNRSKNPILYFSKKRDMVFGQRNIKQFQAAAIIGGLTFLLSFIPLKKIIAIIQ
jgi:hypothetical protein